MYTVYRPEQVNPTNTVYCKTASRRDQMSNEATQKLIRQKNKESDVYLSNLILHLKRATPQRIATIRSIITPIMEQDG